MATNIELLDILTYRRKHGSASEMAFIDKYITPLEGVQTFTSPAGAVLAYAVEVGEGSTTMFSCHTDTVHRSEGIQTIVYDPHMDVVYKAQGKDVTDTECLGADDGAGIWLMLRMIEDGVPGTYVFHRAEECGGVGSSGMAQYYATWLRQFERAVAFDRRGTGDVITHQARGRCCSDEFAIMLADMLTTSHTGVKYEPSAEGIFTDTANYTQIIPECTNLSCGYEAEHGVNEMLDTDHLNKLLDACLVIDWDALPTVRDPSVVEPDPWGYALSNYGVDPLDEIMGMSFSKLTAWVRKNDVATIADVLSCLVDQVQDLTDQIACYHESAYAEETIDPNEMWS